jgi:hypothetical protein
MAVSHSVLVMLYHVLREKNPTRVWELTTLKNSIPGASSASISSGWNNLAIPSHSRLRRQSRSSTQGFSRESWQLTSWANAPPLNASFVGMVRHRYPRRFDLHRLHRRRVFLPSLLDVPTSSALLSAFSLILGRALSYEMPSLSFDS